MSVDEAPPSPPGHRRAPVDAPHVEVTAARLDDCPALARINVASWRAAYASLFPAEYLASLCVADREASWRGIIETSASRTLAARRGGEVLGYITFGACRDAGAAKTRGEVWALYVAPAAWSSGAGWALWQAARVRLLHRGCEDVSLWVLSGNERGQRFYRSVGFEQEAGSAQRFERGGATLTEVKLVFSRMSAEPSVERAHR